MNELALNALSVLQWNFKTNLIGRPPSRTGVGRDLISICYFQFFPWGQGFVYPSKSDDTDGGTDGCVCIRF